MTRTICEPIALEGVGLHGGIPARLEIRPARRGTGILKVEIQ